MAVDAGRSGEFNTALGASLSGTREEVMLERACGLGWSDKVAMCGECVDVYCGTLQTGRGATGAEKVGGF